MPLTDKIKGQIKLKSCTEKVVIARVESHWSIAAIDEFIAVYVLPSSSMAVGVVGRGGAQRCGPFKTTLVQRLKGWSRFVVSVFGCGNIYPLCFPSIRIIHLIQRTRWVESSFERWKVIRLLSSSHLLIFVNVYFTEFSVFLFWLTGGKF